MEYDFEIYSTELRTYHARHGCVVREVIRSVDSPDKLLVSLIPPIPRLVYGTGEDLDELVLAPRFEGSSLVPVVTEWPCDVYMCVPNTGGNWQTGPYRILDWGRIEPASRL